MSPTEETLLRFRSKFADDHVRVLAASRRETLRRMALTLLGLSGKSLNAVLALACWLRHLEGLPGDRDLPRTLP